MTIALLPPLNDLPALSWQASTLLPLALFAFVNSITPGPNNVMLTASGATFGYRRSLRHMLGITLGGALMLLLVGAGLGTVFQRWDWIYTGLKGVGAAYLVYLAWRIAQSGGIEGGARPAQPLGFWAAAAFQWVNPKAWIIAVGIVATYTPRESYALNLLLGALVLAVVNFPSISAWTLFGSALRRWLQSPTALRRFNHAMAVLLLLSLYPLLGEFWAWASNLLGGQ